MYRLHFRDHRGKMDKNMDDLAKHWSLSKRWFPSPIPVRTIGWRPGKTYWVDRKKKANLVFSFLFRGEGELWIGETLQVVKAPCLIILFPWQDSRFGPTGTEGTWDELYVTYYPEAAERLQAMGLVDWGVNLRKFDSAERIRNRLQRINDNLRRLSPHHRADWLDRAMENFFLDLARDDVTNATGQESEKLYTLVEWLKHHLDDQVDWAKLAKTHGMSPRSFRRHWKMTFDLPPTAMLKQLRVQEAKRLLEETDYQIQDIGTRVGIHDRLYFSRMFKEHTDTSPKAYRDHFRAGHSEKNAGFPVHGS